MADSNPERGTEQENAKDMRKVSEQLARAARVFLHEVETTRADDGVRLSVHYAQYLASYMLWISSERIEKLTRRLNVLTFVLVTLTAALIAFTIATWLL